MLEFMAFSRFDIVSKTLPKLSATFSNLPLASGIIFFIFSEKLLVDSICERHSLASVFVVITSLGATRSHSNIQSF